MLRLLGIMMCVALLLTSCASSQPHYDKVGAGPSSEEDLQRTIAKCRVQAAMAPGEGAWGALTASAVRSNCMRAEGWVRNPPCDPAWNIC